MLPVTSPRSMSEAVPALSGLPQATMAAHQYGPLRPSPFGVLAWLCLPRCRQPPSARPLPGSQLVGCLGSQGRHGRAARGLAVSPPNPACPRVLRAAFRAALRALHAFLLLNCPLPLIHLPLTTTTVLLSLIISCSISHPACAIDYPLHSLVLPATR